MNVKVKIVKSDDYYTKGEVVELDQFIASELIKEGIAVGQKWEEESVEVVEFKDLKTAMIEGVPELNWIVDKIVPERGITIIGAPPKNYKTFFAMDMALDVSMNEHYLSNFSTIQCNVLYVDEENGYATLLRRFKQLGVAKEIKEYPENLFISSMKGIKLDDGASNGRGVLSALIEETGAKIVILDSLVRFMVGKEDNASDVRKVFESLKWLMEEYGVSFVILHHFRKGHKPGDNAMDSLRGSGDFAAFADVIVHTWSPRKGTGIEFNYVANRHVDVDELGDFLVKVDKVGDGLLFKWLCEKEVLENKTESVVELVEEWFEVNNVVSFSTKMCVDYLKSQGFTKRDHFYDAMVVLQRESRVDKVGRGNWRVNDVKGQVGTS